MVDVPALSAKEWADRAPLQSAEPRPVVVVDTDKVRPRGQRYYQLPRRQRDVTHCRYCGGVHRVKGITRVKFRCTAFDFSIGELRDSCDVVAELIATVSRESSELSELTRCFCLHIRTIEEIKEKREIIQRRPGSATQFRGSCHRR